MVKRGGGKVGSIQRRETMVDKEDRGRVKPGRKEEARKSKVGRPSNAERHLIKRTSRPGVNPKLFKGLLEIKSPPDVSESSAAPGRHSQPPPMEKFLPARAKPERALMRRQCQTEAEQRQHFISCDYDALLRIFEYLKVKDLLRAARVCRMWNDVAVHPSLWKTVRMMDRHEVTDWNGFAEALKSRGTRHLHLRKMLDVPAEYDSIWKKFVYIIPRVTTLRLYHCPIMTTVIKLGMKRIGILESLTNLETLELGECFNFPEEFGTRVLPKLQNLKRLRLEKGTRMCEILEGVSKLENLSQLELVYFDMMNDFDKCLANCKNIKRLLIIPTYTSQATSNEMVLDNVVELSNNLTHFVWGFTSMEMKVTDYYLSEDMDEQITDDSVPIWEASAFLKFTKYILEGNDSLKGDDKVVPNLTHPQPDFLPLPQQQKILFTALPKTRIKFLIIPYNDMWRYSILRQEINEVIAKEFKKVNNAR